MITIEPRHLEIVKNILGAYDYTFYAFGSRVTQKNLKKFSDLDLFYLEPIPSKTLFALEEAFEESDLPYKVDLVDFFKCNSEFQKILRSQNVELFRAFGGQGRVP